MINWTNAGHGRTTVVGALLTYLHERGAPADWCEQVGRTIDETMFEEVILNHLVYPMERGDLHRAGPNPGDLPNLLRQAADVLQRLANVYTPALQDDDLMRDVATMCTTLEATADRVELATFDPHN